MPLVRYTTQITPQEVEAQDMAMLHAAIATQRSLGAFSREQLYRRARLAMPHEVLARLLAHGWLRETAASTTHIPDMRVTRAGYTAAGQPPDLSIVE